MGIEHSISSVLLSSDGSKGQTRIVLARARDMMVVDEAPSELLAAFDEVLAEGDYFDPRKFYAQGRFLLGIEAASNEPERIRLESVMYAKGQADITSGFHAEFPTALSAVNLAFWARQSQEGLRDGARADRVDTLLRQGFMDTVNYSSGSSLAVPVKGTTMIYTSDRLPGFPRNGFPYKQIESYLAIGHIAIPPEAMTEIAEIVSANHL